MLENLRIILIEPSGPANIGAVCRAMFNMGLSDLHIVSPRCELDTPESRGYATHAQHILQRANVVADIPAALTDCISSFVTSAKLGLYRRQVAETPRAAAMDAVRRARAGKVALAFGREDRGILTDELLHFDRVITIPANPDYPVMNLAAAVMLVCYELRLAASEAVGQPELPTALNETPADEGRKTALFEQLFAAFDDVDVFRGQNPTHLRYILRQIFGRANMTAMESDVMIGVARQIRYYVQQRGGPLRVDPSAETRE
ncbi:MAG: RNA methyltransferase [Phycisphaerae bacterium]